MRGKILAALTVPVLVLCLAASMFSLQAIRNAQLAGQAKAIVAALPSGQDAVTVLQAERLAAVQLLQGVAGAEDAYTAAQAQTDTVLAELRGIYTNLDITRLDPMVSEAVSGAASQNVTDLAIVRDNVGRGARSPALASTNYTAMIDRLLNVPASLAATLTDRQLAVKLDAYVAVNDLFNKTAVEVPLVQYVLDNIAAEDQSNDRVRELSAVFGETNAARTAANESIASLDGDDLKIGTGSNSYTSVRRLLGSGQIAGINSGLANTWGTSSTTELEVFEPIRVEVLSQTDAAASQATSSARQTAIVTVLATVLTVLASVAIAIGIARRITVPLRHLTQAAAEVREQLPKLVEQVSVPGQGPELTLATIKVESTDEVGQLAAVLNAVNATTVEVAKEQAALRGSIAEMFVNVARRDHVLLNRQLAFLDELERSEEDANTLANLFRLDHLATRMRRNSESLLVLAGIDSGRRVRAPMPISDVVRTASSEIELYDRVRLNLEADPFMLGHNALNAAHLLAELLENATTFSEPNTPVEVTTNRSTRYVTVEVRDHGLGMSETDIVEANQKVASRSASDVIGVQRLGLFVVGRLADRLGAHVVFSRAADGSAGTTATVSFPLALFVDEADVPLEAPADPLSSSARQATQDWIAPEPDALPVDIAALTDGATSIGMPRRRAAISQPAEQTADVSTGVNEMVLPPLEAANPDVNLASATDQNWTPAQTLSETLPAGLPSRPRSEAAETVVSALEPVNDTPILDGERRGAMFSNFRTRASAEAANSLEASGSAAGLYASATDDDSAGTEAQDAAAVPALVIPGLAPDEEFPWQAAVLEVEQDGFASEPSYDAMQSFEAPYTFDPAGAFEPAESFQPVEAFDAEQPFAPVQAFEPVRSFEPVQFFEPVQDFQVDGFRPVEAFEAEAGLGQEQGAQAARREELEPITWPQPVEELVAVPGHLAEPESLDLPEAYDEAEPVASYGAHLAPMLPVAPSYEGLAFEPEQAFEPVQAFEPLRRAALPHRDDQVDVEPAWTDAPIGLEPDEVAGTYEPAVQYDEAVLPEPADAYQLPVAALPDEVAYAPVGHYEPANSPAAPFPVSPAAQFEPTMPTFADVVSDAPTRRSSRQSTVPAKRGAFGWLRRKGHTESGQEHGDATVAPTSFPTFNPAGSVASAPVAPAPVEFVPSLAEFVAPVPDRAPDVVAPAPVPMRAFEPLAPAPSPAVASTVSGWMPATSISESGDDGGFGGFGGWAPPAPVAAPAPSPLPLKELPLSGQDAGDSWSPPRGRDAGDSWSPPSEIDGDISSMLAMRSNIQEQALAELSQLSSYRPAAVQTTQGGGLTRRTRGEVAATTDDLASQKISRDAAELRSRLSAFQSATSRGRQAPETGQSGGGAGAATASATFTDNVPDSAPQPR
ncbi:sensor histidine kinase [Sanguibacter gelidistatuariae]|uniref:sensor histidine kinase n=1 Tax=Sanguibacter gelidistatuariae TaxID=1814289 RepID=UPI001587FC11|nr:ATP-binding protein [Sanguibacter gelidistatuariae]